jgi:hypothetical protein
VLMINGMIQIRMAVTIVTIMASFVRLPCIRAFP